MAVGIEDFPRMYPVAGFALAAMACGIKSNGRSDLVAMACGEGGRVAGVFTRNAFCAAPVQLAKRHLQAGTPRLLLTNSGNANAGTGEAGVQAALATCTAAAAAAGLEPTDVLPFSTGVIGELLPAEKINAALPELLAALSEDDWQAAAEGIMTTDTLPKGSSRRFELAGQSVTITGIAKGSGMIRPDMATMLAYVATDLEIAQEALKQLVKTACDQSFNRITVDGDTSTNDSAMLIATGKGADYAALSRQEQEAFAGQLNAVFADLAQRIIRDGEGATKFVSVVVEQGRDNRECLDVAYAIAESPLVKTALFAGDPNWGRILAAVGRAGVQGLDVERVRIFLGDALVAEHGGRAGSYTEAQGQAVMSRQEIVIRVELNRGGCAGTVWTTDLSYDYVKINAEYRT